MIAVGGLSGKGLCEVRFATLVIFLDIFHTTAMLEAGKSEEHEITVTYLEIATGRITHILSVIS